MNNTANIPFKALDRASFKMLYDLYAHKMYRLCLKDLQQESVAADIVHNVFLSIWERRESLVLDNPEAFLISSVKIQIFKYFRDSNTQKQILASRLSDFSENDNSTQNEIIYNDLSAQVMSLVNELPKQCKRVYLMRDQEQLSNAEIATSLGISVSAVKQHIGNARSYLRRKIKP